LRLYLRCVQEGEKQKQKAKGKSEKIDGLDKTTSGATQKG